MFVPRNRGVGILHPGDRGIQPIVGVTLRPSDLGFPAPYVIDLSAMLAWQILLGAVMGQPMDLVFQPLEVAAVAAAVGISALIALDGESNWLEGALLMIVYAILAFSFFEFVSPIGL